MEKLEQLALAIKKHEGFFKPMEKVWLPLGSKSYRNNNPGNQRFDAYRKSLGADYESLGFAHFPTYELGWNALLTMLSDSIQGKRKGLPYNSKMTLPEFFGVYSFIGWLDQSKGIRKPNYTYANFVAKELGIPVGTKMEYFITKKTIVCPKCGETIEL